MRTVGDLKVALFLLIWLRFLVLQRAELLIYTLWVRFVVVCATSWKYLSSTPQRGACFDV